MTATRRHGKTSNPMPSSLVSNLTVIQLWIALPDWKPGWQRGVYLSRVFSVQKQTVSPKHWQTNTRNEIGRCICVTLEAVSQRTSICLCPGMLDVGFVLRHQCGPAGVFGNGLRLDRWIVVLRRCVPNALMHGCNHKRRQYLLCCLQFKLRAFMLFLRAASWFFGKWNQKWFWTLGTKIGGCPEACHVINNVQQFVKLWIYLDAFSVEILSLHIFICLHMDVWMDSIAIRWLRLVQ